MAKCAGNLYCAHNALRLFFLLFITLIQAVQTSYAQSGCTAPAGVKIVSLLAREMTISWDSASIGTGNIVRVAYSIYPGNNFIYREFTSPNGGELTGLKPATQYLVRVDKLCGAQHSATVSLGTIRTLSLAEEQARCAPESTGDLCAILKETATGERGSNFIEIVFPKPPANLLAQYPDHQITVRFRTLDAAGNPVGNWAQQTAMYADLSNEKMKITGLAANTLYEITITWVMQDAAAGAVKTCQIPMVNTPTTGSNFAGPVFKKYPLNVTIDCNSPEPFPVLPPPISGGCSSPVVTYSDAPVGTGCDRYVLRTWMALDNCGRTATASQTIFFQDNQAPTFVDLPAAYAALECGENLPTEEPTAVDNCSAVTLALAEQTQGSGCDQTITRTWTARDACNNTATYVQTIVVSENVEENNGEDPQVPPLPVNCGQSYTPPVITNNQPLNGAQPGDVFNIAGFPALLKEVSGGSGSFSGLAKVRLPFGNKVVYVDFSNISVNTDKKIFQGQLIGVPDPNFIMPDPGNFDIGGDICLPEPPIAANGFNEDGQYIRQPPYENWQPGDPIDPEYDPNGFDANGYHKETGTQFNKDGCSQEGLDKDGNPCNPGAQGPYYWLHNNHNNSAPTTPEGIAYATEIQPGIRAKVEAAINALIGQNATSITNQRTACGTIRTTLNARATGLDRKYLFGAADEFINEDMHLQFNSKPIALQINVPDRKQQIEDVEESHIELYYCDKLLYKYKQTDLILKEFKSQVGLDVLVSDILDAIKRLSAEKVNELKSDPNKLTQWLKDYINGELGEELQNRGLAYQAPRNNPDYMTPPPAAPVPVQSTESAYQYLAAAGDTDEEMMRQAVAQSFETTPEDLEFEFRQGWEYVGNTSRAFYLDAIADARETRKGYTLVEGQDPESLLPIKIEKEAGGRTYTLLLDQIKFTTSGASLDAYLILEIPNSGQRLVFRATNVPFSAGGLGSATAQLRLDSDVSIRLNNTAKLIIKGSSGNTYVNWNCNGFAGMSVGAEIEFCRNFFIPLNPTTLEEDPNQDKRVKAYFTASMPAWGEFIASLTMDPFALAKHPDFKWEVQNAWLDFSDTENPANFVNIAANYNSEFKNGSGFSPQWKGFYMERLRVTLPKKFNKNNQTPIQIIAEKLVIDDRGLTGLVTVQAPLIPLSEGNLDGWAFSMDRITVAVVGNRIQGGGFGGLINVPIFGSPNSQPTADDCFRYEAKIIATANGELYEFTVTPADSLNVNIWVGKVILKPSSYLKVTYANDAFTILANLTGTVRVDGDLGDNIKLNLPALDFENIQLSNKAPYFRSGTFGVPIDIGAKIGGFGLTIKGPTIGSNNDQCTLDFGATIRLVSDSDNKLDIGASTSVALNGEMVVVGGRQRWKFKDFEVKKIHLKASWKGVDGIEGYLEWYKNHATFGRGFRGKVAVKFSGMNLGNVGVEALAQFGSVADYKYFLVDALVNLGNGIPMGALSLKGLGGGAYYHMNRDTNALKGLDQASNTFSLPDQLGVSMSGILYTPSLQIGLGLKAMVIVATAANEQVFNAGLNFEVRFNSSQAGGGIKDIALYGSARLMAPIQFGISSLYNSSPTQAAPVSAKVAITYDFPAKTLHGELTVYANVYNVFVGAGANDMLGHAEIHFAPNKWYINVGTPSNPTGIKIKIPVGNTGLDLFTVKSYLCIGTAIPPMPPLPNYVRQMTGAENFMADESRRATGRGFAFGASVELNTGELKFLIFYAQLQAGLGFDVMIQKYEGITCSNNDGKPLGINGWYASGQSWAYIDADVGLKFRGNKYTILNIGAAAALQVKLPNPFWARGAVGGKYKILGGLVKGKCNFKFTLGKSCDTEGEESGVQYVKLIEELTPYDKAEGVETVTKPVAYFGVPVGGTFTLSDDDGNEEEYSTNLLYAKLTRLDGTPVAGFNTYSPDLRQLTLKTPNMLEGNTTYRFIVGVDCRKNGQLVRSETDTVVFTTAASPSVIPPSNVVASYPLDGMYNFYRRESAKGYIQLRDGQPDLLEEAELMVRFFTKTEMVAEVPATYSGQVVNPNRPGAIQISNSIDFDIPWVDLPQNQFLLMELVEIIGLEENQTTEDVSRPAGKGPNARQSVNLANPVTGTQNGKVLYSLYFRTSIHDLFADKVASFAGGSTQSSVQSTLILTASNKEPFDQVEIFGTAQTPPLVQYLPGPSDFYNLTETYYKGMSDISFRPLIRAVADEEPLQPKHFIRFLVNGSTDSTLRADVDKFTAGTNGITNAAVALQHTLFTIARADFGDFRQQFATAIDEECHWCLPYDGSDPIPDDCDQNFLNPSGPWPPARCCCSSSYYMVLNYPLWDIYVNPVPKPAANTIHPVFMSYHLPNSDCTTPGVKVDFKHINAGY